MSAKILIIDPSLLDRKRMTGILQAAGHETLEFDSAAAARRGIAAMPSGNFKLILTEWHLPDEEPLAWIDWLHQVLPATPVVVVTPSPSRETIIDAVNRGAATLVAKPFGGDILLRRVTETLAEGEQAANSTDGHVSWRVQEYLRRELKRAARTKRPVAVTLIRVFGPEAESPVIGSVSRILRESDLVSRLEPNHLIVILPETDQVGVSVVETRIWQVIDQLQRPEGNLPGLRIAYETGSASYPVDGAEVDELIAAATARLRPPLLARTNP